MFYGFLKNGYRFMKDAIETLGNEGGKSFRL
jgi:hypothetical protein